MDWQQLVKSCHSTHVYLDDTAHRSLHWTLGVGSLVAEGAATIAALSSVPTSTPSSPSPKIITGREEKVTVILGGIVDAASLQSLQAVTSVHTHVAECTIWCAVPPLPASYLHTTDPAERLAAERAALDKIKNDCEQWFRTAAAATNDGASTAATTVVTVSSAGKNIFF